MRNTFALIGLAIALMFVVKEYAAPPARDVVTLYAAPGNSTVQMFNTLHDAPNASVNTLRDGLRCTRVSELLRYGNGDSAMFFYRLNCGGRTGYVNADWVR